MLFSWFLKFFVLVRVIVFFGLSWFLFVLVMVVFSVLSRVLNLLLLRLLLLFMLNFLVVFLFRIRFVRVFIWVWYVVLLSWVLFFGLSRFWFLVEVRNLVRLSIF